jgi:hypothetical protein
LRNAATRLLHQQLRDGSGVPNTQLLEHHDLVQPVEELWSEVGLRQGAAATSAHLSSRKAWLKDPSAV